MIDLNEENPEVTTCPRKSVVSGLPKEFENSGNDSGLSVLKWLENIINEYNNENIKLYEKELIRDKNQMSIKSVRDLEDGFVIGLAVRVSPQDCHQMPARSMFLSYVIEKANICISITLERRMFLDGF